jgi:hypothetical protein
MWGSRALLRGGHARQYSRAGGRVWQGGFRAYLEAVFVLFYKLYRWKTIWRGCWSCSNAVIGMWRRLINFAKVEKCHTPYKREGGSKVRDHFGITWNHTLSEISYSWISCFRLSVVLYDNLLPYFPWLYPAYIIYEENELKTGCLVALAYVSLSQIQHVCLHENKEIP